jgi:hypothetical protein
VARFGNNESNARIPTRYGTVRSIDAALAEISFPAVIHQFDDGAPLGFLYEVVNGFRGFVPPFAWPTKFPLHRGGLFDSKGVYFRWDGAVGTRPPIPVITALANGLALGGALFVALHGNGSYGPRIVAREPQSRDRYREWLRQVIFDWNSETGTFRDHVDVTDRKLSASTSFEQMVETVRWHVLTDGGTTEMPPTSKYFGRAPEV